MIARMAIRPLLIMIISAALFLTACGGADPASTPAPAGTPLPRLAVEGPPCQYIYWGPYHNVRTTCVEVVLDDVPPSEAVPALWGLAFAPDDTLFAARTAQGEIWAMRDIDGDKFLDAPVTVAAGLQWPLALAWHADALYVLTSAQVLRLDQDVAGLWRAPVVLVDDLATDTGYWPGSIGIGPDERLYVTTGADCVACADAQNGQLLSFDLSGGDRRVEATGLHHPTDFAWHPDTGDLWLAESAPVESGSANDTLRWLDGESLTAAWKFPMQSNPWGMVFYEDDAFPFWEGTLVVALYGSATQPEPAGYAVQVVGLGNDGLPNGLSEPLAPVDVYRWARESSAQYSLAGEGFFPYHPVDVVVSAEGWLYVSMAEGRIFRFRPRPAS